MSDTHMGEEQRRLRGRDLTNSIFLPMLRVVWNNRSGQERIQWLPTFENMHLSALSISTIIQLSYS